MFATVNNSMQGNRSKCMQVFVDVMLVFSLKGEQCRLGFWKLVGDASFNKPMSMSAWVGTTRCAQNGRDVPCSILAEAIMPTHAGATLVSSSFGSLLTLTHPVLRYSFYEITFAGPLDDEQRNADYALCLFARGPNLKHVMFSFTNVILFRLSTKCRLACAVNDRVFIYIYK